MSAACFDYFSPFPFCHRSPLQPRICVRALSLQSCFVVVCESRHFLHWNAGQFVPPGLGRLSQWSDSEATLIASRCCRRAEPFPVVLFFLSAVWLLFLSLPRQNTSSCSFAIIDGRSVRVVSQLHFSISRLPFSFFFFFFFSLLIYS